MSTGSVEDRGWLQGSLVPNDLWDSLLIPERCSPPDHESQVVIISQSCDLTRPSAKEPWIELLILEKVARNNSFIFGKNPRRLHLDHNNANYEVKPWRRPLLPKATLEASSAKPIGHLDKKPLDILKGWLGRRYTRTALPTELQRRLEKAKELDDFFKTNGEYIESIYLMIDPLKDIPIEQTYDITAVFVITDDEVAKNKDAEFFDSLIKKTEELFKDETIGISFNCEARAMNEITLDEINRLIQWNDFDFESNRN